MTRTRPPRSTTPASASRSRTTPLQITNAHKQVDGVGRLELEPQLAADVGLALGVGEQVAPRERNGRSGDRGGLAAKPLSRPTEPAPDLWRERDQLAIAIGGSAA